MQNFGRFLVVGGAIAGGYVFYRLAREWWNPRDSGPPSVVEASSNDTSEDITVTYFDDENEEKNEYAVSSIATSEDTTVNYFDDENEERNEYADIPTNAESECMESLAPEMLLTDSEIEWKLRNEEMFSQGDVAGAFDFYDEESIMSKVKNTVSDSQLGAESKYLQYESNVEVEENDVSPENDGISTLIGNDTGTSIMTDVFPERDNDPSDVTKPLRRKRKRFRNARKFFKSLSCFGKPLTDD